MKEGKRRRIFTEEELAAFKDGSTMPARKVVTPARPGLVVPNRELMKVTTKELMEQAAKDWRKFAGREVPIGEPTEQFLDFLERYKGREHVGKAYWPGKDLEFKQDSDYPGWLVKPVGGYWSGRVEWDNNPKKNAGIPRNPLDHQNMWIVYDESPKPDNVDGSAKWQGDPFGVESIINDLQRNNIIPANIQTFLTGVPSRLWVSGYNVRNLVLPELAKKEGVSSSQTVLPSVKLYNIIGNMYHPEWGMTNTGEFLSDTCHGDSVFFGGNSNTLGLASARYMSSVDRDPFIGFRPLFMFPTKA